MYSSTTALAGSLTHVRRHTYPAGIPTRSPSPISRSRLHSHCSPGSALPTTTTPLNLARVNTNSTFTTSTLTVIPGDTISPAGTITAATGGNQSLKRGRSRTRTILPLLSAEWERRERERERMAKRPRRAGSVDSTAPTSADASPGPSRGRANFGSGYWRQEAKTIMKGLEGTDGAFGERSGAVDGDVFGMELRSFGRAAGRQVKTQPIAIPAASGLGAAWGATNGWTGTALEPPFGTGVEGHVPHADPMAVLDGSECGTPQRRGRSEASMGSRSSRGTVLEKTESEIRRAEEEAELEKRITALGNVVISKRMASPRISPSAIPSSIASEDDGALANRVLARSFQSRSSIHGFEAPGTPSRSRKGKSQLLMAQSRESLRKKTSRESIGPRRVPLRNKASLLNNSGLGGDNVPKSDSAPALHPPRPASALSYRTPLKSTGKSPNSRQIKTRWSMVSGRGPPPAAAGDFKFPMRRRLTGKSTASTARQETNVVVMSPSLGSEPVFNSILATGTGNHQSRAVSIASLPDGPAPREASEIVADEEAKARKASILLKCIQDHDMENLANRALNGDYTSEQGNRSEDELAPEPGKRRATRADSLGSAKHFLDRALSNDQVKQQETTSSYSRLGLMTPLNAIRRLQMRREISVGLPSSHSSERSQSPVNKRSSSDTSNFSYTRWDGTRREITEQDHPFHWNYLMHRNSKQGGTGDDALPTLTALSRRNSGHSVSSQRGAAADEGYPDRCASPVGIERRPPPSAYKGSPRPPSTRGNAQPTSFARPAFRTAKTLPNPLSGSVVSDRMFTPPMTSHDPPRGIGSNSAEQVSPMHRSSRSTSFDSRSAYEAVKGKDGYVSFEDVAGLGIRVEDDAANA